MTDNESNLTVMNNNCGEIITPGGNIVSYDLKHLSDSGDVVLRINEFVREASSFLVQLELPNELQLLKKILQITVQRAYQFHQKFPKPNLGDCMNIMIKDKVSIQDTNPMLGYYYEAMVLEFLQRSMRAINADPEHINELDSKITENFLHFKNEIGQPVERDNFER